MPLGGGGLNLSLFTLSTREHCGTYRRSKAVLWLKIGRVRPTCQAGQPCNLVGRPSFLFALPLGIGYLEHRLCWTCRPNYFLICANTWLTGQGDVASWSHLGSAEAMLCVTSFPRVIFYVTMLYFGYNEDMHGFWSIWCFFIIRCF
jgi:hypothetical protein